jgi:hypothetical protein
MGQEWLWVTCIYSKLSPIQLQLISMPDNLNLQTCIIMLKNKYSFWVFYWWLNVLPFHSFKWRLYSDVFFYFIFIRTTYNIKISIYLCSKSFIMLQAGRLSVRVPDEVNFFNWPNPSSCTMALDSTQPLKEMSTRNLPGGKNRPVSRADNLSAICEPNV